MFSSSSSIFTGSGQGPGIKGRSRLRFEMYSIHIGITFEVNEAQLPSHHDKRQLASVSSIKSHFYLHYQLKVQILYPPD